MNRTPSLTESALLSRFALDLLVPSNFQKLKIPYDGDSVLDALKTTKKTPIQT